MKVFKINDCDWYIGNTLEEAIAAAMEDSGLPMDEVANDPYEEDAQSMARLKFVDDDGVTKRTFQEELQRRIDAGAEPSMFASTEY